MDDMNITSAKYVTEDKIMIFATIDNQEMTIPTDLANIQFEFFVFLASAVLVNSVLFIC